MARVVKVSEEDKEKYPIIGKDGEYYTERLDVDNAMEFGQFGFLDGVPMPWNSKGWSNRWGIYNILKM